jgi:hypothetical protein
MKNNTFHKKGFEVIRNLIDPNLANFLYQYFVLKKKVADTLLETKYIAPFCKDWGYYEDPIDGQVPHTYSIYGDVAMETLLQIAKPLIEKHTNTKLIETYAYARMYKKGDILKRHKDRFSCEISTTINLGGDKWPIYIATKQSDGKFVPGKYVPSKSKGFKVDLNPGDVLLYKGGLLEHWRNAFKGKSCGQVFLHYNNVITKNATSNAFEGRPHLGLPSWFRNSKI